MAVCGAATSTLPRRRCCLQAYHVFMARMLFLLIGLALIGLGVYWRWIEPAAAAKAVVTDLDTAVRMVRDCQGRIPVRDSSLPSFALVYGPRSNPAASNRSTPMWPRRHCSASVSASCSTCSQV